MPQLPASEMGTETLRPGRAVVKAEGSGAGRGLSTALATLGTPPQV